jgi:phage terminase small subunit
LRKKLTPQQEEFCQAYVELGSATEALIKAYNTENMKRETINNQAYKMLKHKGIAKRIDELQEEIKDKSVLNSVIILNFWAETITNLEADLKDRLKASELGAKYLGMFEAKNKEVENKTTDEDLKELLEDK